MKNSLYLFILFIAIATLNSCKGKKTNVQGEVTVEGEGQAVCIWDKVSLKETPDADGKWLTSLSLGEKCNYLDEEKEISNGDKKTKYIKVELQDGKQGWVQSDFIVIGGKPGAITQEAVIYSRPDLLTKTDKSFSKLDIVGIKSVQNNFIEVAGKRKDGKWIETGWIKPSNISESDIDVAVAKFAAKALATEDIAKQQEAIQEILNNSDFSSSVFIEELSEMVKDQGEVEMEEDIPDTNQIPQE